MLMMLPFMLFGGAFIHSDDAPVYFAWIQYISPVKYSYEALMKVSWNQVDTIACNELIENCAARTGKGVLRSLSMLSTTALEDTLILVAIDMSFRAIGFVALVVYLRGNAA